jgi:hypothetical protein
MVKKIINFFLKINFFLFHFLWVIAFIWSILESFTYQGFLPGTRFLFFFCILSGILARIFPQKKLFTKKWTHGYKYFFVVNKFIFPLILAFTVLILIFEKIHYPNYIFSLIHLQPRLLFWPGFLSGFAVFLGISGPNGRWFLISNKLFFHKIGNLIFASVLLIFAVYHAVDLIDLLYKTEGEPERKIEVQYATREINIFQWIETLFPKMKEVIYWCEKDSQNEDLISFDPALIWTSFQGLSRVYMTNCHLQYIATREGAEDFLQGRKTFKWLASINECDPKMILPEEDKSTDASVYLETVNNYFVCQAKPLLPGLFVLEKNKR